MMKNLCIDVFNCIRLVQKKATVKMCFYMKVVLLHWGNSPRAVIMSEEHQNHSGNMKR